MWAAGFWADDLWAQGLWAGEPEPNPCWSFATVVEYLAGIGIVLPECVTRALIATVDSIDNCLAQAGYPPHIALQIKLYLLALLAMAQGDRYVSSQTAPSGASRSFRFRDDGLRYRNMANMLRMLDPHGCTYGLVPPDPTKSKRGGIWTARGGCL